MRLGFIDEPGFTWRDMGRAVLYLLKDQKNKYLSYSGILFLVLFYEIVPTLVMAKIVDFFIKYKIGQPLNLFYGYVVFLAVAYAVVSFVRLSIKKKLANIQSQVAYTTKVNGFERLLDFSVKWHDSENSGNKVQRIQNGIGSLRDMQNIFNDSMLPQLASILGVVGVFLFINKLFFLFCLAYISIFILIQASFYKKMLAMNNTYNSMLEKASGVYYEGLNNILTLKTLGVKNDFKKNIISREELSRDLQMQMTTLVFNKWKFFQVFNGIMLGVILFITGHNFVLGVISVGSVLIVFNYFQKLSGALGDVTGLIERLITVKVSIARMMPIFWESEVSSHGEKEFPKNWENISIKNATFNYQNVSLKEEETKVKDRGLKDVTFSINKYEKVGVVGQSGSGKSTFAKVLLGLYKFENGSFKIGESDFYDIKHDQITSNMALVLQDSEMFNLSLKENITLMRLFDEELFKKAISIARLEEIIARLPDKEETLIGEKGYRLSGGERQRIGIARAVYKDPQIFILDEATSSLDSKTESLIQEAFDRNLKEKTVISIAHRVSTLKSVDKIVVFDEGKIVEEGSFEELSKNTSSKFFEIYQNQNKN